MVKLVIKDESVDKRDIGIIEGDNEIKIDQNAFRELANNIMEQYPYDEQGDMEVDVEGYEDYDEYEYDNDNNDNNDGPTFTYPSQTQNNDTNDETNNNSDNNMTKDKELEVIYESVKEQDETWVYLNRELTNNNTYVMSILKQMDISPDCEALNDFYYSNYSENTNSSKELISQWKLLDSLNTILSEPSFARLCLNENMFV